MSSIKPDQTATADTPVRVPLGRAALGGLVAPAIIGGLFAVAALTQPGAADDVARSGVLGLLAGVLGAGAGLCVLMAFNPRPAPAWPMALLFAGGVRMFGGLGVAVPLYMTAGAEKLPFWGVFLAVALTAIVGELASLGGFLRSLSSPAEKSFESVVPAAEARSA